MALAAKQANTPREYIYIRTNAIIDDSWIGTPVDTLTNTTTPKPVTPKKTIKNTVTPKVVTQKKKIVTAAPMVDTLQVSDGSWIFPLRSNSLDRKDGSWILTPRKTNPKKITPTVKKTIKAQNPKTGNIILNSAPEEPNLVANSYYFNSAEYMTPNGTPLNMVSQGNYTPAPSNKIDLTSLSATG